MIIQFNRNTKCHSVESTHLQWKKCVCIRREFQCIHSLCEEVITRDLKSPFVLKIGEDSYVFHLNPLHFVLYSSRMLCRTCYKLKCCICINCVCVRSQSSAAAAGPGEAAPGRDGEESESSLLRHGAPVCPARPHAPVHEGQVHKYTHNHTSCVYRFCISKCNVFSVKKYILLPEVLEAFQWKGATRVLWIYLHHYNIMLEINLAKCFLVVISFHFQKSGSKLLQNKETSAVPLIQNPEPVQLMHL